MDEDVYRDGSAILPGVEFLGTGSLSDRIWMKPSVTVLGMDLPNTAEASNVLLPEVTAKLSMRIIPGSDADAQLDALMDHLRAQRPWNCEVVVEKIKTGHPFAVDESHPAIVAAKDALSEAYGAHGRVDRQRGVHPARRVAAEGGARCRDHPVGGRGHRAVAHPRVRRVGRPSARSSG